MKDKNIWWRIQITNDTAIYCDHYERCVDGIRITNYCYNNNYIDVEQHKLKNGLLILGSFIAIEKIFINEDKPF